MATEYTNLPSLGFIDPCPSHILVHWTLFLFHHIRPAHGGIVFPKCGILFQLLDVPAVLGLECSNHILATIGWQNRIIIYFVVYDTHGRVRDLFRRRPPDQTLPEVYGHRSRTLLVHGTINIERVSRVPTRISYRCR